MRFFSRSRILLALVILFVLIGSAALFIQTKSITHASSPTISLQLPWPTGQQHNIYGGYTYGCGDHVNYYGVPDYYAIDFNLVTGQPVSAVADGIAHTGFQANGYGNYVWILHPGNFVSLYGHLNSYAISNGTSVSQGQVIGYAGSTGNSTGAHLHFVIRSNATNWYNGNAYKPEPMSGYTGFGNYGIHLPQCSGYVRSPLYTSIPEPNSPPPPPPNPYNTRYVGNLYYDILNRVGSPVEVNGYVQMLNQGTSRTDVANLFLASQEYRTNLVNADYQLLLGRQADLSGLQAALTELANGARNEDLLAGLAGSDEFYNRAGGTPNGFASALYQDLLGRPAASSEIAAVVQQLNNGVPRATIAHGFVTSQEYYTKLVKGYYQHYLGRQADPSGLANAVSALSNGAINESIIAGLVASDEYFGKPLFSNVFYVRRLYQDILGRPGSSNEVYSAAQALDSGASRATLVNNFLASQEYRTNLVNAYFQLLLGRQPNSSELQAALTQLANGGRDEDLLAGLAGSDEFYSRAGGTPTGFANALYQDLLGRPAASSEIAAVVQQLNNGVPRPTITQGFVTSPEYYTKLVKGYYQHYLGRQADASGLANAVSALSNGATNESIIAGLVISEEYYWK